MRQQCPPLPGFTLVEIMLALLVLSAGMIGIAGLQGHALSASASAVNRTRAVMLAADVAERIRSDRRAAEDLRLWQRDIARSLPGGTGSVGVDAGAVPLVYTVTVSWAEPGRGQAAAVSFEFALATHGASAE